MFVDGLGLGDDDRAANPVYNGLPQMTGLVGPLTKSREFPAGAGDVWLGALDACLGVEGIPQSATGQTSLLTGVNAARIVGRHVNAYPTAELRELLQDCGLFAQCARKGLTSTFLNAFRPESVGQLAAGTYRTTATTAAVLAAGLTVRTFAGLERGQGVTHDITGWSLRESGIPAPEVPPETAADRALDTMSRFHFTLVEHFLTDMAGHARDFAMAGRLLDILDRFCARLIDRIDPLTQTLLVTSDHGNIEDLTIHTHTKNPVPLVAAGRKSRAIVERCRSITDVAPAIMELLTNC